MHYRKPIVISLLVKHFQTQKTSSVQKQNTIFHIVGLKIILPIRKLLTMSAVALLIASSFGKQKRLPCKTTWGNKYGDTSEINTIELLFIIGHVNLAGTAILPT